MQKTSKPHPLPVLASLAIASIVILVLHPTSIAEDAGNLYNTPIDVRLGERYFERQCSRCHGFDAKGNDETGAPDLTGRLSRASTNVGIYNILRTGIPGTAMLPVAADLPDSQVWQLVAYIDSLSSDPANIILAGSKEAGAGLYRTSGCNDCHMITGAGGRQGPDLSRIGETRTPEELANDLVSPHDDVAPRWWTIRVQGPDGVTREGLRMNEDSFSLRIIDSDANLWSYSKSELQSYEREESSTMPSFRDTLSDSDIDDIVAFLFSQRKELLQ